MTVNLWFGIATGAQGTDTLVSIERVETVRRGRVRRSKLYYLRQLAGKAARLREKRVVQVPTTVAES